jgi:hypothetical protein
MQNDSVLGSVAFAENSAEAYFFIYHEIWLFLSFKFLIYAGASVVHRVRSN